MLLINLGVNLLSLRKLDHFREMENNDYDYELVLLTKKCSEKFLKQSPASQPFLTIDKTQVYLKI
jgi:hypothetical protein